MIYRFVTEIVKSKIRLSIKTGYELSTVKSDHGIYVFSEPLYCYVYLSVWCQWWSSFTVVLIHFSSKIQIILKLVPMKKRNRLGIFTTDVQIKHRFILIDRHTVWLIRQWTVDRPLAIWYDMSWHFTKQSVLSWWLRLK